MNRNEFVIKSFETNYPEMVALINEWTEHSIKQNWGVVKIILNQHTVPNCPADKWDESIQKNARWNFYVELGKKIVEYMMTKGYPEIHSSYPQTLVAPDGRDYNGYCITAYTEKQKPAP